MKKKRIAGVLAASAMVSALMCSAFAGCSLVTYNEEANMQQVVAEINVSKMEEGLDDSDSTIFSSYKSAVETLPIYKNELVAAYLNVGYSYMQNYNFTAAQTFDMLLDNLVDVNVLTQYAVMYVLDYKVKNGQPNALTEYLTQPDYLGKLEYLLKDPSAGDESELDIKVAEYNLYVSINEAIDSYEQNIIEESKGTAGDETRTTPGGVDEEDDDYYPRKEGSTELDYNVYTGYKGHLLADSGKYQEDCIEGTTKATRNQAYRQYLDTLTSFGLIDRANEDVLEVSPKIGYFRDEFISRLESRLIEKYYDIYEESREAELKADNYKYLKERYEELYMEQSESYKKTSGFESAFGNLSDTSFMLYSPDTEGRGVYGYVYNILLPFDAAQNVRLKKLQEQYKDPDSPDDRVIYKREYYDSRNELLKNIKTYDRREPWFNGATEYAFDASAAGFTYADTDDTSNYFGSDTRKWLFFENNLTKSDRYKPLDKYIGKYSYNGEVFYDEDKKEYYLEPEKLTIDQMLAEFEAYIDYVLGKPSVTFDSYDPSTGNAAFYEPIDPDKFYQEGFSEGKNKKIDYSRFIYAKGQVDVGTTDAKSYRAGLMDKTTDQYKALAAVNELQFAYTTDTGILSRYIGYNVTLEETTNYIKEFETACHAAIERGPGSFVVCAGDYGWHIIYVTYTFGDVAEEGGSSTGGAQYTPDFTEEQIAKEGTFENLFYEWVKSSAMSDVSTTRRTEIINRFKGEKTVTTYQSRYEDLRSLS